MIKTIVFDHGGVISNSIADEFLNFVSEKLGIEQKMLRDLMDKYEGDLQSGLFNHVEFWKKIIKEMGLELPDSKLKDLWLTPYIKFSKINPQMISLVNKLKENYRVGLISNTQEPHVSYNRKRGSYKYFDPVVLSNEVGFRKPDKKIFELYLEKVDLKPDEMVFIDDAEHNLTEAKEMGIHTILFKNYEQLTKELKKLGVKGSF